MIRRTRYAQGLGLSQHTTAGQPRALSDSDPRLRAASIAAWLLAYLRSEDLQRATSNPTPQAEYVFSALVAPAPAPLMLTWNRVEIYATANPVPGDGQYYLYRTDGSTGPIEQRLRLGRNPDPGDRIRAPIYVVDVATA